MRKLEKVPIRRDGQPVAGHKKIKTTKCRNRLAVDPSLRVLLRCDPVEPLTEEEFPAEFR
jgi:hypothetical protein